MHVEALLPFLVEADRLKNINRQTLIHNGGRFENSAEHSWHLAIAVLIFKNFGPTEMDINKALRMDLLHDIVEIDAGDMFVYGDLSTKKAKEIAGLQRLTGLLPNDIAKELREIWLEFENGESVEAKFVSALDRFLPLYSNYLNEGHSWKNHGIPSSRVIAKSSDLWHLWHGL